MNLAAIQRLLVLSPNWLGDAVLALPAIGDLRRACPDARVTVAARGSVAGLFGMSPVVDHVLRLEWTGRLSHVGVRRGDVAAVRSLEPEVAVLLPNSFGSAWFVRSAGVPERWGYASDLRGPLLSRAVPLPAIRSHQSQYYRHLVGQLGVEAGELEPNVVVPSSAVQAARSLLAERGWDGTSPLVVVAPGAAYGGAKRWPSGHFAWLTDRVVLDRGAFCALVGSAADSDTTGAVRALVSGQARPRVLDLAGATTLESLAGVMSLARACVSNDSGAMHVAGAVGVPLVALFGPTRERETAPLGRSGRRADVLVQHVWCRPCMLRECPLDHRCMTELRPERVLETVTGQMTGTAS